MSYIISLKILLFPSIVQITVKGLFLFCNLSLWWRSKNKMVLKTNNKKLITSRKLRKYYKNQNTTRWFFFFIILSNKQYLCVNYYPMKSADVSLCNRNFSIIYFLFIFLLVWQKRGPADWFISMRHNNLQHILWCRASRRSLLGSVWYVRFLTIYKHFLVIFYFVAFSSKVGMYILK